MRVATKGLMDNLGVDHILGPYETMPWSMYDTDKGITASAEVRMDPGGDLVECEIQFVYDTPPEGKPPVDQIMLLKLMQHKHDQKWTVEETYVEGVDYRNKIYNWEQKSCNFFRAVVMEIMRGDLPDIEDLKERELHEKERFADQWGGGSSKAPKIKADGLLVMNNFAITQLS